LPIERWLEGQKRFAHLLHPENAELVELIQQSVDRDWAELGSLCRVGDEKGASS
jgi:hypothetical protein